MKKGLKFLSLLLVLIMASVIFPVSAFAATEVYDTDEPHVEVPIHMEDLDAFEQQLVQMDGPMGDKFRDLANILTVQPEYWKKNAVKGTLEKKYSQKGSYKVSFHSETSEDEHIKLYQVWYPTELKTSDETWPVVIYVNGSGVPVSDYKPVLDHMASWGFVVIGCEDAESSNGYSGSTMLDYLLKQNNDKDSIFYHKINTEEIGCTGHSMGGNACINAATKYDNGRKYIKTIASQSAPGPLMTAFGLGAYDSTKLEIPCFFVGGNHLLEKMVDTDDNFQKVNNGKLVVAARRDGCIHSTVAKTVDPYVTAWMLFQLRNDPEAASIFVGTNPEIQNNENYIEVEIKNA